MEEMNERLKIKEQIARLAEREGLEREKVDKVPVSPEEEHVLDEIQRLHKKPTRASVWRWLLANYARLEWSERVLDSVREKEVAKLRFETVIAEVQPK